ncbi:hypothetical protein DL93DRAFT_2083039 [Clavulina sp. PMI_390]|nr:hypothetical protein DL93DRAFT_2083039 [Clavulina sp. PMI_390]
MPPISAPSTPELSQSDLYSHSRSVSLSPTEPKFPITPISARFDQFVFPAFDGLPDPLPLTPSPTSAFGLQAPQLSPGEPLTPVTQPLSRNQRFLSHPGPVGPPQAINFRPFVIPPHRAGQPPSLEPSPHIVCHSRLASAPVPHNISNVSSFVSPRNFIGPHSQCFC